MTESQLLDQLRKAISDIDKSRLRRVAKFCLLANCLSEYRDAMHRHAKPGDVAFVWELRRRESP